MVGPLSSLGEGFAPPRSGIQFALGSRRIADNTRRVRPVVVAGPRTYTGVQIVR